MPRKQRAADSRPVSRKWVAGAVIGGTALAGVVAVVLYLRWPPPQMSADEAVFKTVDAMYTAVRSHDAARLAECEMRLDGYRKAGRLSASAQAYLHGVAEDSGNGRWDSAARTLYRFMLAQRAERGRTGVGPNNGR